MFSFVDKEDEEEENPYLEELRSSHIYTFASDTTAKYPELKGYFVGDISNETLANKNFRKVLYTTEHSQLVLMCLRPGEDIGLEVHDSDQFFRVERGRGFIVVNGEIYTVGNDSAVVVPGGSLHNVKNTGDSVLQLYTVYSPPHHKDGLVHKTKKDAEENDIEYTGHTTEKHAGMPVHTLLRRSSFSLKHAAPHFSLNDGSAAFDMYFEYMSKEDKKAVYEDLLKGAEIHLANFGTVEGPEGPVHLDNPMTDKITLKDVIPEGADIKDFKSSTMSAILLFTLNNKVKHELLTYDTKNHCYKLKNKKKHTNILRKIPPFFLNQAQNRI